MTPPTLTQSCILAAVLAAATGISTPAGAQQVQANHPPGTVLQSTNAPAPNPAPSPAPSSTAAPSTAMPPKPAAKPNQLLKPEPTEDEIARIEQERSVHAVTNVRVIRGSLFSAGEAPIVGNNGEHERAAPVLNYSSVTPMEPKKFRKHDILTVIVRQDSSNTSSAKGNSEKKQDLDFALQEFLKLSLANLSVSNSSDPSQLPAVKFKFSNNRENTADQQRTDSTSMRISGTVVDIKPNGTLVIEATAQITMDREVQHMTLSGVCRAEDVAVDNTLLSTQLADLKLAKTTSGEVRDGTKRGWLNSLIDKFNPF